MNYALHVIQCTSHRKLTKPKPHSMRYKICILIFFIAVELHSSLATLKNEEAKCILRGKRPQYTHSFIFARASRESAQDGFHRHSLVCALFLMRVKELWTQCNVDDLALALAVAVCRAKGVWHCTHLILGCFGAHETVAAPHFLTSCKPS